MDVVLSSICMSRYRVVCTVHLGWSVRGAATDGCHGDGDGSVYSVCFQEGKESKAGHRRWGGDC